MWFCAGKLSVRAARGGLPPVQLLFQSGRGFGVGGVLLTGGDQGGDAALQLGVLVHGQSVLADKGAALKNLPGDAQQNLAAVGSGQTGVFLSGAGVDGLKLPHGSSCPPGFPQQGQSLSAGDTVHPPLHRTSGPGSVAVFVGNEAGPVPFPAVDSIEHGGKKGTPGGFAGFVGGLENVQAVPQLQCLIV